LRIIAGIARGRRLTTPIRTKGRPLIRPTSDRAREALFSIIGSETEGARVLDLFAGTGALGLEAVSRGAAQVVFVDRHRQAVSLIRENIALCRFDDQAVVLERDLLKGLSFLHEQPGPTFSLIFLDPPYGEGLTSRLLAEIAAADCLAAGGLVVAEDAAGESLPEKCGGLVLIDQRRYGDTGFWFYRFQPELEIKTDTDMPRLLPEVHSE
jgi:16S rRNA (guanine966-N2)-methyltransferase